ncbi:tRNA1(Val) (adenine(37)-N6)-methyltransferase [Fibrella sp. WM1]|uniref:tRNA1(Val) (adenine(37)-N6)-methyltransferase n=1 Tax=Fibrella musci TaxID=3242485 RepID=UPI0035212355
MFRFKQFTIQQDQTAMKVCTDACVLGAWAQIESGTYLLDIGTGTGLLALMAAQRNADARINAVELDDAAAQQAAGNVAASPFANRITVHQTAIQQFIPPPVLPSPLLYDHILTNPPFYVNSLRSPDKAVNRALHTDELPFADLLVAVRRLLAPTGTWWVLLPPPEMAVLRQLAAAGSPTLVPAAELHLRHHDQKPVFRHLVSFRFDDRADDNVPDQPTPATLAIYEPDGRTYTAAFRALLQPYYLIF